MSHRMPRTPHAGRRPVGRATLAAATAAVLTLAGAAGAQDAPRSRREAFELRPFAGAFIPTGGQRDLLHDAFHVGAQASYSVAPSLAVVGTFGWSPSRARTARGDEGLDVLHYDAGVEGRAAAWLHGAGWDFTPFAGLGVGGRTYNYRDLDVDAQSKLAGYGALGGEFGFGRFGARVEARDYLSRSTHGVGRRASGTRNDVTVAAGLTVRF